MLALSSFILLAITGANAAPQLDFDEIFGNGNSSSSSCAGTTVSGYCCNGSVINPSGDFANNNNADLSGLICCVGDPKYSFNNGPSFSTCSAGSAVPLTEAASATAAAGSTAASSAATTSGVDSGVMSSAATESTAAGSSQTTQTSGSGVTASESEESSAGSSVVAATQSSTGAAGRMATLVPALGGIAIGVVGLL